ncbi:MAG: hypothetical protein FD143_2910 [Ignavibacteria bacterium]|nr:MAG: hypothetical protein FD143_2910 [Ignavibacteria bacterium]
MVGEVFFGGWVLGVRILVGGLVIIVRGSLPRFRFDFLQMVA